MKNTILGLLLLSTCFFSFPVLGQQKDTTQMEEVFINPEIIPYFEGGNDNFYKIITENIQFTDDMIEGRLFIQCTIDTLGKMKNIKVARGLSEENDKEALRLMEFINQNYNWKSGRLMGKKQERRMNIPIVFKEEIKIYTITENPPVFEGGQDNFYKIISKNLKLEEEEPNGIGSRVLIEFVIDTTGKMTDFKILKSDFSKKNNDGFLQLLDSINSTYTWKPAIHKGKKVFFRMSLPIIICRLD